MISAKDEFFLEREHVEELANLVQRSDAGNEYWEDLSFDGITDHEFDELRRTLLDRELKPLEAAKRGCTLSAYQINKAVKQAAKDE